MKPQAIAARRAPPIRAIASVTTSAPHHHGTATSTRRTGTSRWTSTQPLIASRVSKKLTFSHSISPDQNAEVEITSRSG